MISIVIPARQTGRWGRFPGKATCIIDDRTLVEIAIDCATEALRLLSIDAPIIVSTDDLCILQRVGKYGTKRPDYLCTPSSVAVATVANHVSGHHAVQLNVTSPLRSPATVAQCIDAVLTRPEIDYVATVRPVVRMPWPDPDPWTRPRTQEQRPLCDETGEVFVYGPDVLAGNRPINPVPVVVPGSTVDIDREEDLLIAMAMIDAGLADLPPKRSKEGAQ